VIPRALSLHASLAAVSPPLVAAATLGGRTGASLGAGLRQLAPGRASADLRVEQGTRWMTDSVRLWGCSLRHPPDLSHSPQQGVAHATQIAPTPVSMPASPPSSRSGGGSANGGGGSADGGGGGSSDGGGGGGSSDSRSGRGDGRSGSGGGGSSAATAAGLARTATSTGARKEFCLVSWFELELAEGVWLSSSPTSSRTHWRQLLTPVDPPCRAALAEGEGSVGIAWSVFSDEHLLRLHLST